MGLELQGSQPVATVFAGVLSCIAVIASAWISSKIANKNISVSRKQIKLNHELKLAEFRQAWINSLRDTMAEFHSIGTHPNTDQTSEKDFYKLGTKIELLMNPSDPDYQELHGLMYKYLNAKTLADKFSLNPQFINLSQRILKREWDRLKSDLDGAHS